MKALRFHKLGDLSELHVEELPRPVPGPDEVLVKVLAASINPSDVKNVLGKMEGTTLPRTPGRDFAGVVVDSSKELAGLEIWGSGGDIGFVRDGSHAEYLVIPRSAARPKPRSLSMVEAASVGVNYLAAFLGLEKACLKDGETVLVTGVAGGVGSSVAKIAKSRGARVIGVDLRLLETAKAREYGIDLPLSSQSDPVVERVREFTGGKGADVAFDCVGGPLFETVLNALGLKGRQVNITSPGQRRVSFDLVDFYHRQLSLYGIDTRALDTVASGSILDRLRPAFEDRRLKPPSIFRTCGLAEAVEAYRQVNAGAAPGKIVITFGE